MYHQINIKKLSPAQISKLLNGHRIRVSHGSGHMIHASHEQHNKITKAHKKGCGTTIQFDPYQIENHKHLKGIHPPHGGSVSSVAKSIGKAGFKSLAPIAVDYASNFLKNKISGHGEGMHHSHHTHHQHGHGEGMHHTHHAHYLHGHGEGMHHTHHLHGHGESIYHPNHAHTHGEALSGGALNAAGYGKTRGRKTKGRGIVSTLAKSAFKAAAPILINEGAHFLHNKIKCTGKGGRRGRPRGKGIGQDILKGIKKYGPEVAKYAPLAMSFL